MIQRPATFEVNIMVRFFLVGILVGWVSVCNSQNLNHSIRNYTAIDGLPQSQVEAIVEDGNGYLWLGTQGGGLAMFDGRQFKVYTTMDGLLSNFVTGLRIDTQKNIWILHPRGLTKFDGLKFTKFHFPGWNQPTKNYRSLLSTEDGIYVFSEEGLTKIKNDSIYFWDKVVGDGKGVKAPFQTPLGDMGFYLETGEILMYTDTAQFIIPGVDDKEIRSIFKHGNEQWFQFLSGTFRLNIKERRLEKLPHTFQHYVRLYDAKNDVYWTRDRENLYKEKFVGEEVQIDTVLKDVSIVQVLPDAEGNVWFGSDGSGLFKYYYQDFDRCASDNLKGVMAIHVDKNGTSWIGTASKGLWSIKHGKVKSYTYDNTYKNMIHDIGESPDGTLWVATAFGLGKLNRDTEEFNWITEEEGGIPFHSIRGFTFDDNNGMWVATNEGILYYKDKNYKQYTSSDGLKADMAWVISYLPKSKSLFVGGEFGLNTIKDGKVSTISIPELDNTLIFGLHPYRDSLMVVGTGGSGVLVFDPKSYKRKLITKRDGLTSDFVYFVAADDDRIWIGTEKGITRLKLDEEWEITENLHYDDANGLTGIETNQGAYYLSDEHKYFGLVDGIYEFNDLSGIEAKSFDLHLTDVEIFYGDYSARDFSDSLAGFFKIPVSPILPSDKNHITFHFNRVDKRYPKSVRFRYLLQNFDKTWSQPSASTQVTYSNLPPGNYAFRVMATNNQGSWSEDKVMYTFTVKAPFYQTASFITGIVIFIAGSVTLLMYLRVRQKVRRVIETERIRMKEQESLRKEIARDFHDEMGNQLTRIINYVSLLKLNVNGSNGSNGSNVNGNGHHGHSHLDLYSKVEESAKVLYTGTRDFIWSIDPVNDELSKLFVHIRDFGEKLFEEKEINFRAYDEVKERLKLPHGFSREANLIFKEAMTNAFKYSQAKNVTFTLRKVEARFQMSFEDDGIGFCTDHVEKSNGLKNIRERSNRVGAVLRIHSSINNGTQITLDFKLTKTLEYGNAI